MSDKEKPGFFKRLFGFGGAAPEAEPKAPEAEKPVETPAEKKAPAAKKPAPKKPAAKKPAAKTPAAPKKPAAKKAAAPKAAPKTAAKSSAKSTDKSAAKPSAKASKSATSKPSTSTSKTPRKSEGTATELSTRKPQTAAQKKREDEAAAKMAPKTPPPGESPSHKPGQKQPEDEEPSRRTEEAPQADDEAGPASPRPTDPDGEPAQKDGPASPSKETPPAGPGPSSDDEDGDKYRDDGDDDEEEAGPMAPEPKQEKAAEPAPKKSWFAQLRQGLARTSNALSDNISSVLTKQRLDEDTLDDLEDVLIRADLGVDMAERVRSIIGSNRYDRGASPEAVRGVLVEEVTKVLEPVAKPFPDMTQKPFVWLVVGVNGTGKTTTIGKLAHRFSDQGKTVMMAAADTFRAAAIDQLKIWGERVDAEVVSHAVGSDPAGVAYDGVKRAQESKADVLLIDTAGRLQNKSDLMDELAKIVRVIRKFDETAPHGVLLVLDATTGQNALNQVDLFQQIAGVTGLVVTKLDGTARGGILVSIAERFNLPVHAIGVGEGIDDLESFDADDFARAIAGFGQENAAAA